MLFACELKPEVIGKAVGVALDRFVESVGANTIERGQIRVQKDAMATKNEDPMLNLFGRDDFDGHGGGGLFWSDP